jgi:hypothetical protein
LEYWSADSHGIEESPHNILTGIELGNGGGFSTNVTIGVAAVVTVIAATYVGLMLRKRRKRNQT